MAQHRSLPRAPDAPAGLGAQFSEYGACIRVYADGGAEIHLLLGSEVVVCGSAEAARREIVKLLSIEAATPRERVARDGIMDVANRVAEIADELLRLGRN